MSQAIALTPQARPKNTDRRIVLRCDFGGEWTLSGAEPALRFTDLDAALDCARRVSDERGEPVEVWCGGEYICCMQPPVWPRCGAAMTSGHAPGCPARRSAQEAQTRTRPVLWLMLIVALIAASVGWHVL